MCRTSRPAGSVLRRPARAGRRAGLVRACGRGGLPDRCHPHRIEAAVEALAECPSLPPGWKTGTAALRERRYRAARVPNVPVRDWIRQSRSMCLPWTGDRPVMYRRIPAPVTCLDHQAAKSACAAASEVPGRLAQKRQDRHLDLRRDPGAPRPVPAAAVTAADTDSRLYPGARPVRPWPTSRSDPHGHCLAR